MKRYRIALRLTKRDKEKLDWLCEYYELNISECVRWLIMCQFDDTSRTLEELKEMKEMRKNVVP